MNISILTVFPQLFDQFLGTSLIGRAVEQKKINVQLLNYFSYCPPKQRIDAPPFGHGAGMVMKPEVVGAAIEDAQNQFPGKPYRIFFSPQGKTLDQYLLKEIAQKVQESNHLMIVSSRYEGMDERVEQEYADLVLSIGDYVLMGGDVPAMVLLEGLLRLVPGIVGKEESVALESFEGPFVDYPTFTAPVVWKGREVPEILRSGNHAKMEAWRHAVAVKKSVAHHFEWVRSHELDQKQRKEVLNEIPPHYCILLHSQVMLPDGKEGTTSVTSMDIHDIARSGRTFGIKNYLIVTPLKDQQSIVRTLLDFWQTGRGVTYNNHRHEAVSRVELMSSFDEALEFIRQQEDKEPVVVTIESERMKGKEISYYDQDLVWSHKRPVVLVFGTAKGLSQSLVDRADYLLDPIDGLTDFNHLSVRSAVAIVFDRWLGLKYKRRK